MNEEGKNMKKDIQFADVIRFLGVILILLCHYTEQSTSVLLNMSAQFFNIGVPIFIILSGFLFGVRDGGKMLYHGILDA